MKKNTYRIRPVSDWLLVKRKPLEKVSPAGIIIIETDSTRHFAELRWGEVLAAGPGKWSEDGTKRVPMSVKPGDVVGWPPVFQGLEQGGKMPGSKLGSEELLLRDSDVWAKEEA